MRLKKIAGALAMLFAVCATAVAEQEITGLRIASPTSMYSLGVTYSEDEASAVQAGADFAFASNSHLHVDLGWQHSPQELADLDSYRGGVGFYHDFDIFGFSLGYEYWGDRDFIDTHKLRGALSVHGDVGRIALLAE